MHEKSSLTLLVLNVLNPQIDWQEIGNNQKLNNVRTQIKMI